MCPLAASAARTASTESATDSAERARRTHVRSRCAAVAAVNGGRPASQCGAFVTAVSHAGSRGARSPVWVPRFRGATGAGRCGVNVASSRKKWSPAVPMKSVALEVRTSFRKSVGALPWASMVPLSSRR